MLQAIDVTKTYGGVHAVDGVSFTVQSGSVTGLIGPNGAGKTTLFNLIAGTVKPASGRLLLAGARIDGRRPDQVFRRGLARTFHRK